MTGCSPTAEVSGDPAPSVPAVSSAAASDPATTASPTPTRTATSPVPADEVVVALRVVGDTITPSGERVELKRGQTVVLEVTSDIDDEIHAHTGGDGLEIPVKAGVPARGTFVAEQIGSFEVESHELGKVFVILNVR
jgi:hypothetical protein